MLARHPLADGILFDHWSSLPDGNWHWPNFTPRELSCRRTGEYYHHIPSLDAIQRARDELGPLQISSGHRSHLHNAMVGGAPRSAHLYIAFDIPTRGRDPRTVEAALRRAGFGSIGRYQHFLHADGRPGRAWYGTRADRRYWEALMAAPQVDVPL